MKAADVEDKIVTLLVTQYGIDRADIAVTKKLSDDGMALTSLDIVEFSMSLEEDFGITIRDDTAAAWETLGDVFDTVRAEVC